MILSLEDSSAHAEAPTRNRVPPMLWIVLLMGVVEMLERVLGKVRLRRTIAFVRLDHWARRHGF